MHICKLCSKPFKPRKGKLFCTSKCHERFKNWTAQKCIVRYNPLTGKLNPRIGTCNICGKGFEQKTSRHFLCSKECKRLADNKVNLKWGRNYYSNSPENYLKKRFCDIRRQIESKTRKGINIFDLKEKELFSLWLKQNGKCSLTGFQMTHDLGSGMKETNASVDRINRKFGYTLQNIRLVCLMANIMRHTMNDIDLIKWCEAIIENAKIK